MPAYTRIAPFISLLIAASAGLAIAHASAQDTPAQDAPASQDAPAADQSKDQPAALTPKLLLVRELRELDLRPKDDSVIMSGGNSPGLHLSMSLGLPEGSKVSAVTQPKKIRATDNKNTDLTKIDTNFDDEREWLSVEQWFDDPPTLEVSLTIPARTAETFSLAFEADVTTYSGIEHTDIDLVRKWTPLSHASLVPLKAEYRINPRGNFEVRPVAARELIESVIALGEGMEDQTEPQGHSVSWDDKTAEFSVDPAPEEGQKIRIWVRADVKTVPVRVDIKDQKLP